jgi:hypothetical protein
VFSKKADGVKDWKSTSLKYLDAGIFIMFFARKEKLDRLSTKYAEEGGCW